MMLLALTSVLALLVIPSEVFGFLHAVPNPVLKQFPQTQAGTLLGIRLDVGINENSRMNINGLVIELHPDGIAKGSKYPALPGANGPDPKSSTGAKNLFIRQSPYYINSSGMHQINLEDGCWELAWKEGSPSGTLVCCFHHTEEAKRNDAIFPKGRIYMAFPVWTKETLAEAQERKLHVERRARQHIQDKEEEFTKMQSTSNLLMKAWHYRNAAAAMEKYWICGVDTVKMIPLDRDVVLLQDNLVLNTKGKVWTKHEGFFGGKHALLGTATISPIHQNENELKP